MVESMGRCILFLLLRSLYCNRHGKIQSHERKGRQIPEVHVVRVQRKGCLAGPRRLQRRGRSAWGPREQAHIL